MIATQSNFTAFFLYLAEMYRMDTSGDLVLDKHEFKKDCWCITHSVTGRALQVSMGEDLTVIDYIDGNGNNAIKQVHYAWAVADQSIHFLAKTTAVI